MWLEKRWAFNQADEILAANLAGAAGISTVMAKILLSRGINGAQEARDFLYGAAQSFHPPGLLKGMAAAVDRISRAICTKEKIVIFGDYDVDGITAASLLYLFLSGRNAAVSCYIPERQFEGYGLNDAALRQIAAAGASLLITVDCGISAVREVAAAPPGLDIIITDHHNPPDILPQALALINPKQSDCRYPYKELAGVGVALKLCQGLWQHISPGSGLWAQHLDIVALGTVADIVPLTDENREIVRLGIKKMQCTENIGLQKLIKYSYFQTNKINTGIIGFGLAPRLNAAGRLARAEAGVRLLTTDDPVLAEQLACELNAENNQRQEIEKHILAQAEALLAEQEGAGSVIVLAKEGWHAGVIGIVASRLVDKYYVPVVMISLSGGQGKGSCRSIERFDIYKALCALSGHLVQFGGHRQAAGLTIEQDRIEGFRAALAEYANSQLTAKDYLPVQKVDIILNSLTEIDDKLLSELEQLEPYGMGNPHPVLAMRDVTLVEPAAIGSEGQHLKFAVKNRSGQMPAVMWRKGDYAAALYDNAKADIAFAPEINIWRNNREIRLRVIDVRQENILADFRADGRDKYEILGSILRTGKKTALYCHQGDVPPEKYASVTIYPFGDLPEPGFSQIVFWQPPHTVLGAASWWKGLKDSGIRCIYLLYNKSDVEARLAEIQKCCPDQEKLRAFYRILRERSPLDADELLNKCAYNKNCFDILLEIGAVTEERGIISIKKLPDGTKLSLTHSKLYRALREEEQKSRIKLAQCLDMSRKDFFRLLFAGA